MDHSTRASVVVTVVVVCWLSCVHGVANCSDTTPMCYSCTKLGVCDKKGDPVKEDKACPLGKVCLKDAECVQASETTDSCQCSTLGIGCNATSPATWVTKCFDDEEKFIRIITKDEVEKCQYPTNCSRVECVDPETTTKPDKCSEDNANLRYPHETQCKKYYMCRKIRQGRYDFVTSTCPGLLAFNPNKNLCDLPENVPGCP